MAAAVSHSRACSKGADQHGRLPGAIKEQVWKRENCKQEPTG